MSGPVAYYRLGDTPGSYACIDSSGLGNTGSLVAGITSPTYGNAGPFLYDPNTSLDCSGGTAKPGGGFCTIDTTQAPPVRYQPLGNAGSYSIEMWFKWTQSSSPTASVSGASSAVPNGILFHGTVAGVATELQLGFTSASVALGDFIFYNGLILTTGGSSLSDTAIYNLNGSPYDGNWHHVVTTSFDGTWMDGEILTSPNGSGLPSVASVQNITFGTPPVGVSSVNPYADSANSGNSAQPFPGWISDVALYNVSLTASQIANHYEIGKWFQLVEYGASVGGTNAGRFNKLMAVEGLNSSQMLNVPYPFRTLMYSETNAVTTTSGLNYLQTMSETEPGLIFQSPTGQINAYNRQYQYLAGAASVSNGVFGDSNAASVLYHYAGPSFQLVQDDLDVWNNIQVQSGRSGSQLQQANAAQFPLAAQSASVYGSRTLQGLTSLQFQNDSDALAVAENYLQWYANPVKRVVSISINSWGNNGNNIPQMLQRGLYDRITIQYQGQTPGPQFSQDSLIESIAHSVSMTGGGTWNTTWQMSPYEILLTPFIFGNAAQSQMSGAASVSGSGTSWVLHNPAASDFLSGTMTFTVAAGSTTVAYNATAGQCQTALATLVPSTTVSGGPLNTTNINVTFGSSQASFTAQFVPSCVLTL